MQRLAVIARKQYGLVTHKQALAAGIPRRTLNHWVESGALALAHPAVYLVNGPPASREQTVMAAVLAAGAEAVASHRTAAHFWGWMNPSAVEISVDRPRLPRLDG